MRRDTPDHVKELAKELRKEQTEAEAALWERLRGSQLAGYKFRRQYCMGRYIADFYCSAVNLAIEIDGSIHERSEQQENDRIREKEIIGRKATILRFTNEQVLYDIKKVLDTILDALNKLSQS